MKEMDNKWILFSISILNSQRLKNVAQNLLLEDHRLTDRRPWKSVRCVKKNGMFSRCLCMLVGCNQDVDGSIWFINPNMIHEMLILFIDQFGLKSQPTKDIITSSYENHGKLFLSFWNANYHWKKDETGGFLLAASGCSISSSCSRVPWQNADWTSDLEGF